MAMKIRKAGSRRFWLGMAIFLILLCIFAVGGWYLLFRYNQFTLELSIPENSSVVLEYGDVYTEVMPQAILRGSRFWQDGRITNLTVTKEGTVNPERVGKYTLKFHASIHSLQASAEQTVRILDTQCPEIILTADPEDLEPAPVYQEAGFQAIDNYDGDITYKVQRTEEEGKITYSVVDSSGNPTVVERKIPYYDRTPPEIVLTGGDRVVISVGTAYAEPGYSAMDNYDGDLTELVTVEEVDIPWYKPGFYEIAYTVSDANGNESTVIRQVVMEAAERSQMVYPEGKTIYLTFDDGPGPDTPRLLDVLKKYNAKATFFAVDTGYPEIMKRIVEEGHSLGIHTMTHNYGKIYASPEAFWADMTGMQQIIEDATGRKTWLMRFPGGSSNTVSSKVKGIMTLLTKAVEDAGYTYFDWNVDSMDAGGATRADTVFRNVAEGVSKQKVSIVLQHDIHPFSVDAVERILAWGQENGYRFLALDETSPTMHHGVAN